MTPEYRHTQKSPLCLLIYALAIVFASVGFVLKDVPQIPWLFPPIAIVILAIAASFHHLTVEDQGDVLAIRFGPLPLFQRTVRYSDIASAEVGRTTFLDGWGIHWSFRGGWVWNIWGRDCVVLHFKNGGRLWVGTDNAEGAMEFLNSKVRA
jgi:hypothetical protein